MKSLTRIEAADMVTQVIQSLSRGIVYAMLIILPLQSLWLRIVYQYGVTGKPFFLLSFWYELVIVLVLALVTFLVPWLRFQFNKLDWLMVSLYLFGLLSFLWADHPFSSHIIGLRYSMLPVYAYFIARLAHVKEDFIFRTLKWVIISVVAFSLIQELLWLFVPNSSLVTLLALAPYHKIVTLPQVFSTQPGPNHLGTYLALATVILFVHPVHRVRWLAAITLVFMVLTFSRSALLGFCTAAALYGALWYRHINWRIVGLGVIIATVVISVGVAFLPLSNKWDIVTHGASQSEHKEALRVSFSELKNSTTWQQLAGHGAGKAGPATLVRGTGHIPESWYLQILYEYGFVGLLLYLVIFWHIMKEALKQEKHYIWLCLVGLLANNLFLHTFADNPAATTLFFILPSLLYRRALLLPLK
jgi:hypothetical protein